MISHKYKYPDAPKLLDSILNKVGFNSMICEYSLDDKYKYDRNMVYLYDSEYSINGVYFLDPIREMSASTNYSFFALTKSEIEQEDDELLMKNESLKANSLQMYSLIHGIEDENTRKTVSRLARLIENDDKLIISYAIGNVSKKELMAKIRKYEILLNRQIKREIILNASKSIDKKMGIKPYASYKYNEELKTEFGIKGKIKIK